MNKRSLAERIIRQTGHAKLSKATVSSSSTRVYPFIKDLFPLQADVLNHPSKRKALLCSRRSGKTHIIMAALCKACLDFPGSLNVFIAPSRDHAKLLIWADLQEFNKSYGLNITFNHSTLMAVFPNGSTIWIEGCNTEADSVKFRGKQYRLVCIDEAAFFGDKLRVLLTEAIGAALGRSGDLWLSGTPNITSTGLFHDITNTNLYADSFKVYSWTARENPKHPDWVGKDNWKALVDDWYDSVKRENRWDDNSPAFRREYLGIWHRDSESLVLHFDDERNTYTELPKRDWRYIIGVDDGHIDEFAVALCCYAHDDPNFYIVDTFSQSKMYESDKKALITKWYEQHNAEAIVVDPALGGASMIYELSERYKLPISAATKRHNNRGALTFIEMFSDEMRQGLIKVNSTLWSTINDFKQLTWIDKAKLGIHGKDHEFSACFVKGTQITTRHGYMPIELVQQGDEVLTRKGYKQVLDAGKTGVQETYTVYLSNGKTLVGTGNHRIWTENRGWVPLSQLLRTDKLLEEGETWLKQKLNTAHMPVQILRIKKNIGKSVVYNLTVEQQHEYFAEGVLVHNCRYAWVDSGHIHYEAPKPSPKAKSKVDEFWEKEEERLLQEQAEREILQGDYDATENWKLF